MKTPTNKSMEKEIEEKLETFVKEFIDTEPISRRRSVNADRVYPWFRQALTDIATRAREEALERAKKYWYHAGEWHNAECSSILGDEGVCNCKTGTNRKNLTQNNL